MGVGRGDGKEKDQMVVVMAAGRVQSRWRWWLALPGLAFCAVAAAQQFMVASPDVISGARLSLTHAFHGKGCAGSDRSPALHWRAAPPRTRSFAVTMHDLDAAPGSERRHWTVINIPAAVDHLIEGAGAAGGAQLPAGARHVRTDFGTAGYRGACPPAGDAAHRYRITVYALDVATIDAPTDADPYVVGMLLNRHRLAQASITASYGW